jgi:Xaa-Pro aminopeptidase
MPYDEFEKLKKDLPNVSFVSSNIFWDLRMCKSKAEADKIRKAAEITGKGLERFYAKAKENMKIKDVIRTLFDCYMEEGALRPSFPPNLGWKDIEATTFKKGKAYSLDTAAVFDDYTADISRVIVIGRATQQHKEIYEKAVKLNDAVRKTSRAGTRTKELWNVYQKTITELGFAPKDGIPLWGGWPDRIGHGFGLAGNEPPTIGPNDPHTLRVGDVHCIEPGLAHGDEYIYIEEDVWVTESGSELLSSSVSRDLREIT